MRYLMWMKEISFTLIKRIVLYQTHYLYRTNYLKLRLFLYLVGFLFLYLVVIFGRQGAITK